MGVEDENTYEEGIWLLPLCNEQPEESPSLFNVCFTLLSLSSCCHVTVFCSVSLLG